MRDHTAGPDKLSIARCLLKTHPRAWLLQALRRPESPHAWALRPLGTSVGRAGSSAPLQRSSAPLQNRSCRKDQAAWKRASGRAGERGGARAGKPRCVRMLTITAGSSMAAMIFMSPAHCGQCSRSRSKTRLSRRAQPMRAGAAAGAFSGGLIPEAKNGSATALRVAHGPRLRAWGQRASKSGSSGRFRGRIVIESGESLPQTA